MPFKEICSNKLHEVWLHKNKDSLSGDPNRLIHRPLAVLKRNFADVNNVDPVTFKRAKFCNFCVNELTSYCTKGNDHDYTGSANINIPPDCFLPENAKPTESKQRDLQFLKEHLLDSNFIEHLSKEDRTQLAFQLGSLEAKSIQLNGIESLYKDMLYMETFRLDEYIRRFNPVLLSFLSRCTSTSSAKNKEYLLAKVLEIIYCVLFVNVVLPVCFLQNLLLYVASGSRNAVNLTGKGGPYGSYRTVREWLSNQTLKTLHFPDGDCVVVFDNNQVIGRSWNIKVNHKTKSSVVTTICQLQYDGYENIQRQPQLKPQFWLQDIDILRENVCMVPQKLLEIHYRMTYFTVAERLRTVLGEQKTNSENDIVCDDIDTKVTMQQISEDNKVCAKCGQVNPKTKRLCLNCKTNLKQAELAATQADVWGTFTLSEKKVKSSNYHQEIRLEITSTDENSYKIQNYEEKQSDTILGLQSNHRPQPPTLTVSDPAFVNPNSLESVKLILRQIGLNAGIRQYGKGTREWLFIVCDGLPFGLCNKVVERTLRCGLCQNSSESYENDADFQEHHDANHNGKEESKVKEFDWVILRPGNGHFEMNMFRSFIEVNWDVFFGVLSKLMGFKSENAQRAAKHGTDNHKTWSLLQIAHQSLLDELLVPFVRKCIQNKVPATPQGFFKYTMLEATNPNYLHLSTMTLTYLQAILNFRAGLRSGNIEAITSAKAVFAPLFHARNHPKYQEIEVMESIQRQCVPDALREFFNETESVSLTGNHLNGEGLDFKAEVINKKVQAWMPRGVPTGEDWLRVTRNLDVFEQLQQKFEEMVSRPDAPDAPSSRRRDLEEQVEAFRTLIRRKCYLLQPCDSTISLTSIDGKPLSNDLLNFTEKATKIRASYFEHYMGVCVESDEWKTCLCVTKEEEEARSFIGNMTKVEIVNVIHEIICGVIDVDLRNGLLAELATLNPSRTKRADFVSFHDQVKDILLDQDLCDRDTLAELD